MNSVHLSDNTEPLADVDAEPAEQLQITPPRTYVNASTTERCSAPAWPAVRPGADDNKRLKSRGF
jgi:hypothetical protein